TKRQRPGQLGFSVGHPAITDGSIGARVADGSGNLYVLSNNHVLANSNDATIGDPELQPGAYDGGTAADKIATLSAFKAIDFSGGPNSIDAAIAVSDMTNLDNTTPLDDGYGVPSSAIFGDANSDGLFDNPGALLGLNVQKYGRTTKLTHGTITGINRTVDRRATAAVKDIAITGVSAPASVTQGSTANVGVTVRNVGNQPVTTDLNVSLKDVTDNVAIGASQPVHGLGLGGSATVPFSWTTST